MSRWIWEKWHLTNWFFKSTNVGYDSKLAFTLVSILWVNLWFDFLKKTNFGIFQSSSIFSVLFFLLLLDLKSMCFTQLLDIVFYFFFHFSLSLLIFKNLNNLYWPILKFLLHLCHWSFLIFSMSLQNYVPLYVCHPLRSLCPLTC